MYIDYSNWETFEYKVSSLQLDANNPRIRIRGANLNQIQILKLLIETEKVYELAKKISEEGYFVGEEPIICIENDKKIVLEGNRRTAALKLLQDPKKYLSNAKSKTLQQNILKNNFPVDRKVRCYIAPNRLLANPIIYERHNGATLQKWKTGNQYAFVAEMYYEDGLSIEDICEVLNENRANILKPLKAYNLFYEGKEILEKEEGIKIDISEFDITNLERFYTYEPARNLIGIDFNPENGELEISLTREEFEKRLNVVFRTLIDSERFSRDFNNEDDKKKYVENLKNYSDFDFSSTNEMVTTKSRTSEKKADLDDEKSNITIRRRKKSKKSFYDNIIIPRDKELIFDNEKLDELFNELKNLPLDKKYSFCVLIRTYLEQTLYFYIRENELFDVLNDKTSEDNQKNGLKKVEAVISYIKGKHSVKDDINSNDLMNILKFNTTKEFSANSLKTMLDYVMKSDFINYVDTNKYKSTKDYIERIKMGLDLAIHSIDTVIDLEHNKRAWKHLEPLFDFLSKNINTN
jgi:hypothetical protein